MLSLQSLFVFTIIHQEIAYERFKNALYQVYQCYFRLTKTYVVPQHG